MRKHIYESSLRSVALWRQHLRNIHVAKLLSDAKAREQAAKMELEQQRTFVEQLAISYTAELAKLHQMEEQRGLPSTEPQLITRERREQAQRAEQRPRGLSVMSQDTDRSTGQQAADLQTARSKIAQYTPQKKRAHDEIVGKSLTAFLDHLPPEGRQHIVNDINRTNDDQGIYEVFNNLFTGLTTRMLSRSRMPSVTPSPNERRSGNAAALADTLDEPQKREKRVRRDLLKRDNNCCVITGDMDDAYFEERGSPADVETGPTQGAHIIPFVYATWDKRLII